MGSESHGIELCVLSAAFQYFLSGSFTLKLGEDKAMMRNVTLKPVTSIIGFLRVPGCPRGGGNWGTLRIPREP